MVIVEIKSERSVLFYCLIVGSVHSSANSIHQFHFTEFTEMSTERKQDSNELGAYALVESIMKSSKRVERLLRMLLESTTRGGGGGGGDGEGSDGSDGSDSSGGNNIKLVTKSSMTGETIYGEFKMGRHVIGIRVARAESSEVRMCNDLRMLTAMNMDCKILETCAALPYGILVLDPKSTLYKMWISSRYEKNTRLVKTDDTKLPLCVCFLQPAFPETPCVPLASSIRDLRGVDGVSKLLQQTFAKLCIGISSLQHYWDNVKISKSERFVHGDCAAYNVLSSKISERCKSFDVEVVHGSDILRIMFDGTSVGARTKLIDFGMSDIYSATESVSQPVIDKEDGCEKKIIEKHKMNDIHTLAVSCMMLLFFRGEGASLFNFLYYGLLKKELSRGQLGLEPKAFVVPPFLVYSLLCRSAQLKKVSDGWKFQPVDMETMQFFARVLRFPSPSTVLASVGSASSTIDSVLEVSRLPVPFKVDSGSTLSNDITKADALAKKGNFDYMEFAGNQTAFAMWTKNVNKVTLEDVQKWIELVNKFEKWFVPKRFAIKYVLSRSLKTKLEMQKAKCLLFVEQDPIQLLRDPYFADMISISSRSRKRQRDIDPSTYCIPERMCAECVHKSLKSKPDGTKNKSKQKLEHVHMIPVLKCDVSIKM